MSVADCIFVAAAGATAGLINSLAGGGTLVMFPALLAVGLPARTANMTSSVALIWGYAGGSVGYRRELIDLGTAIRALAGAAVAGAGIGAAVLLVTPADAFRSVVPYLILLSCGLFGTQERLRRRLVARRADRALGAGFRRSRGAMGGTLVSAVYGSYFGAGLGVLLLAVLGITLDEDLQSLNALKSGLSLVVNAVAVAVFVLAGDVSWGYATLGAVAAFAGGRVGVSFARRLSASALRRAVVAAGTAAAVALLLGG
jgi:uncharacterized protein